MKNKIFFYSFMLVWLLLIVFNFILPKVEFSEQENRVLASFPTFTLEKLIDGKYSNELDDYINDHFAFRNSWIRVKALMDIAQSKTESNNVYIGNDGYLFEKFNFKDGQYIDIDQTIANVNKFKGNINVPIYFCLVPNSIYINSDKLPKNAYVYDQKEIIDYIYNKLENINTIKVVDKLKENKKDKLYFRTDHHMTGYGSFLVYEEICKNMGFNTNNISNYEHRAVSDKFLGTFDSKLNSPFTIPDSIDVYENKNNTIEIVDYDGKKSDSIYNYEYLNKKDKYSFFLNGNNAKVVVNTSVKNGKKLLVIKDSYAHIMSQFMLGDFEQIHFIDLRYYKVSMSDYIREHSITDVLFLYNVSNIVSDLGIRTLK